MDVKQRADRYVERGGYVRGERRDRVADDILAVALFIGWHDPDDIMGGERADEAFAAFCRVVNLEQVELRKIIRGD